MRKGKAISSDGRDNSFISFFYHHWVRYGRKHTFFDNLHKRDSLHNSLYPSN